MPPTALLLAAGALLGARAQPACDAPAAPSVPAALRGVAVSAYTQNLTLTTCDQPACAGTCAVFASSVPIYPSACVPSSSPSYFVRANLASSSAAPAGAATVTVYNDAACQSAVATLTALSLAGAGGCAATGAPAAGGSPLGASAFALGAIETAYSVDASSVTTFYPRTGLAQRRCFAAAVALTGAPNAAAGQLVDTYFSDSLSLSVRVWQARWSAYLANASGLIVNAYFTPSLATAYGDAPPAGFIGTAPFDAAAPPAIDALLAPAGSFAPGAAAVGCDAARGAPFPAALTGAGALSAFASDGYLLLGPTGVHVAFSHTARGAGQVAPWSYSYGYCVSAVSAAAAPESTWQVTVGGAAVGAPTYCFYLGRSGDDLLYYSLSSSGQPQTAPRPFLRDFSPACAPTPDESGTPFIARNFFAAPSATASPSLSPSPSTAPSRVPFFTATVTASPQPAPDAWACPPPRTGPLPAALVGTGDVGGELPRFSLTTARGLARFNTSGANGYVRCVNSVDAFAPGLWVASFVDYFWSPSPEVVYEYKDCYLLAPPVPPATNFSYDVIVFKANVNCSALFAPGTIPSATNVTNWVASADAAAAASSCAGLPRFPPYLAGRGVRPSGSPGSPAYLLVLGSPTATYIVSELSGPSYASLYCATAIDDLGNNTWRARSGSGCTLFQRNVDDLALWSNSSAVGCPSADAAWSGALAPSLAVAAFYQSPAGAAVQPAALPPGASPSTTNSASPFYTATGTPSPLPAPGAWACPPLEGGGALPAALVGTGTVDFAAGPFNLSLTAARGISRFNATGAGGDAFCPTTVAPYGAGGAQWLVDIAAPELLPNGLSPNKHTCLLVTPPVAPATTLTYVIATGAAPCAQQFAAGAPSGAAAVNATGWRASAAAAAAAAACDPARPAVPAYLQGRGVVTPNTTDTTLVVLGAREQFVYRVAARSATVACLSAVQDSGNNSYLLSTSGASGDRCTLMQRVADALYVWSARAPACPNASDAFSGLLAPTAMYPLFYQTPRGAAVVEPSLAPGASRSSTNSYTPPPAASPCGPGTPGGCGGGAGAAAGAAGAGAAVGGAIGGLLLLGAAGGAAVVVARRAARGRLAKNVMGGEGAGSVVILNPSSPAQLAFAKVGA